MAEKGRRNTVVSAGRILRVDAAGKSHDGWPVRTYIAAQRGRLSRRFRPNAHTRTVPAPGIHRSGRNLHHCLSPWHIYSPSAEPMIGDRERGRRGAFEPAEEVTCRSRHMRVSGVSHSFEGVSMCMREDQGRTRTANQHWHELH